MKLYKITSNWYYVGISAFRHLVCVNLAIISSNKLVNLQQIFSTQLFFVEKWGDDDVEHKMEETKKLLKK